jgi:hypothetical protein
LTKGSLAKLRLLSLDRDYKAHLGDLVPYAGSLWWALSGEACEYLLGFVERHKSICKFFENTIIPAEMFFQTILGNSPFRTRVRRSLTWTDWSAGGDSPATVSEKHVEFLESCAEIKAGADDPYGEGELLFARKFPDDSEELVRRIDNMILRKEGRNCPIQSRQVTRFGGDSRGFKDHPSLV